MELNFDLIVSYGVRVVGALLLLFVGFKLAGVIARRVGASLERRGLDATLSRFAENVTRWTVLILIGMACLSAFGIQIIGFAAVLGAAGLAIGLAFQGTLSSVAGGAMLLILRPFKAGDVISVGGSTGKVVEIGLFATLLDTPDNRRLVLPNKDVFGAPIENVTFHERRRVDVNVGTDYTANLDGVRDVLATAAGTVEGQVDDAQIVLTTLGASSIDWQVRVWCATPDYFAVLEATTEAVKGALDSAEIGIPYNTVDVNIAPDALQALVAA